jgi:hypothetical protein
MVGKENNDIECWNADSLQEALIRCGLPQPTAFRKAITKTAREVALEE